MAGTTLTPSNLASLQSQAPATFGAVGSTFNGISPTPPTVAPSQSTSANTTSVTPVITADLAQKDYQAKWDNYQKLLVGVNNQKTLLDQQNAQKAADSALKETEAAKNTLEQQKLGIQQQTADTAKTEANTKATAAAALSGNTSTPLQSTSPATSTPPATSTDIQSGLNQATTDKLGGLQDIQSARDSITQQSNQALQSLLSGTIPLSGPQTALITSLQQQLTQNENDQRQANDSYTGAVTEAGMRAGGEYTPQQYAGQIHAAISLGVSKIQNLDNSAAKTMADLEQSFQKDNYEIINKQFDNLNKTLDDKAKNIQDLFTTVSDNLKDQRDQQQLAQKTAYEQVQKPIQDIISQLAKDGAPQSVIDKVKNSADVASATQAASGYLNDPTSPAGMYSAYTRTAQASGKIPMSAGDFMAAQKYSDALATARANSAYSYQNAFNSAAGKAAGDLATSGTNTAQDKLEKQYSTTLLHELSNRSGGLGLQDQKVNQAIHLKSLVNQYATKDAKGNTTYNIPTAQYAELALGLANLISPSGTAEGDRQAIMSKTASGDLKGALQYITGQPQNGNTQAIIKNLVDSIDRQGAVSEQLRDQDVQFLHGLAPTGLNQDRIDKLEKNTLSSYTNPIQNVEQVQNDAIGKIQSFHDASPKNASLIDDIHKNLPNMSAVDVMTKLGITQ